VSVVLECLTMHAGAAQAWFLDRRLMNHCLLGVNVDLMTHVIIILLF